MIEIKKKSELKGAEKYGDCNSCSKRSGETDLYQIEFHYDDSTKIILSTCVLIVCVN